LNVSISPPKFAAGSRRYHRSASLPGSFTNRVPTKSNKHAFLGNEIPEDNNHAIDRHAVVEVICRLCNTRQSSKTNSCVECGIQFGEYHCSICNLWMSNEEQPYHCTDCGFCRVGGKGNFQHCHQCGMCIDRVLYNDHNCKAGKYRSNCPICQEYLFDSRGASHEMPCGHAIHWDCFRQLAAHDSRCPICKKTSETKERMMPTWDDMSASIDAQPVPPDLARVVNITCNDCECGDENRSWHFLGTRCNNCSSFNTAVDQIVLQGRKAHAFLKRKISEQKSGHGTMSKQSHPSNRTNRRRSVV
jgi:RING finger and CHY zinc finger domain-containing protein 1